MKNNKSKKIFIILIILIVLFLIAGTAFALFATDMFKSDKEMFFKYAAQLFDDENGFIDNKLEQYSEKKKNSSYENEGTFTPNIDDEELNNFNITFAGNVDTLNSRMEELVKINYSKNVNFPIMYKKVDDINGIKLSDVSKRYFVVNADEIGTFISKLNGSASSASKAREALLKNKIANARDAVELKVQEIIMDNYSGATDATSDRLGRLVIEAEYQSDDVTIDVDDTKTDDYVGTITITLNDNPNYYIVGSVSAMGAVHWGSINVDSSSNYEYSNSSTQNVSGFDLSKLKLTKEEKKKIADRYLPVIEQNIDNSNFTKVSSSQANGYSLEISNEKLKEILVKILEELKNDELMLDKLTITSDAIDALNRQINKMQISEGTSIITLYENSNKISKIEFQYNDEYKITISKNSSDDKVSYDISLEGQNYAVNLQLSYFGLRELEEIQENHILTLTSGKTYNYYFDNKITFTSEDLQIDDFGENEYIDIAKLDEERLAKILSSIGQSIEEVNVEKLEQAGITGINPIFKIIPGLSETMTLFNATTNSTKIAEQPSQNTESQETQTNNGETNQATNQATNSTTENTTNATNTTNTVTGDVSTNLVTNMENASKETFNARFKQYEGESVRGATVKSLIMQIIANNMLSEDEGGRPIEVTGDVKLNGTEVPDSVQSTKKYKVKCYTNTEGYVNKVEIKEIS